MKSRQIQAFSIECENMVKISIGDKITKALSDSGAQISCINEQFLNSTTFRNTPLQKSVVSTIIGAGGTNHKVKGQIRLPVNFDGSIINQTFQVVASLRSPVILGMDFLVANKVSLNIGDKMMIINHKGVKKVPLVKRDSGCVRVTQLTVIPALGSQEVSVKVSKITTNDVMVKPRHISKTNELLLPNCLINTENGQSNLKILNQSKQDITLRKGLIVGTCKPVNKDNITPWVNEITQLTDKIDLDTKSIHKIKESSKINFDLANADLTATQKEKLIEFLDKNRDIFATNLSELGHTTILKHEILTGDAPPVQSRPYRTTPKVKAEIDRQLDEMLQYGIIEESVSNYSSPLVMVKKKNSPNTKNPELRMCIDFRRLNTQTLSQLQPSPRLDNIIDALSESKPKIISTLDLFSGFWQCEVHENSRHKTAFVTGDRHLQFKRLPFGLKNAPAFFVMVGNKVLKGLTGKFCSIYIDDIIVWSQTFDFFLI